MNLTLTASEKEGLRLLQRGAQERWLYVRVTCVLMLGEGLSVSQVSQMLGIDDNTVYRAAQNFRSLPLKQFLHRDYKGSTGKLSYTQLAQLRRELRGTLYTDTSQICEWVKSNFGASFSRSGMSRLLERIGFSYKKTKQVPCEADPARQKEFLEQLSKLLEMPDSSVFFADGVHPTHNTRSLYGWIESGKDFELPTVSGRDRVNINGAVNAKDPVQVVAVESERINAQSTQELYEKILAQRPEGETVYVVCDNARYYRNKELAEWLEGKPIVQVFLPPYSPNLNLIERLWKLMRKKVIDPVFYRTKEQFRAGVVSFLENTARYEEEIRSLLTLNFRVVGQSCPD